MTHEENTWNMTFYHRAIRTKIGSTRCGRSMMARLVNRCRTDC